MQYLKRAFDFVASYGFATVLFLLLLLLTFLGTLEQVDAGLFETQRKYFNSMFLVHEFFDTIPVLLPGVSLLVMLLAINLIAGGIIRIRKSKSTVGIIIAHLGILFMLFGENIKSVFAEEGHMTLYENEQSDYFQSYYDWELTIRKAGGEEAGKEYVIAGESFQDMNPRESRTFEGLPFEVTLSRYMRNSRPMPRGPMFEAPTPVIDNFFLNPEPLEKEAERNIAGAYLSVKDPESGETKEGILWGFAQSPLALTIGGETWHFDLHKKRTPLPFTIVLDKFHHEFHPGTTRPKMFMSEVTKIEDGTETQIKIQMNEPLRHNGYTFYQSGWGPQNARPGDPLFSTFSVVKNPADQFPLIACIIVTAGMLLHFGQKLSRYLRAETKRQAS